MDLEGGSSSCWAFLWMMTGMEAVLVAKGCVECADGPERESVSRGIDCILVSSKIPSQALGGLALTPFELVDGWPRGVDRV